MAWKTRRIGDAALLGLDPSMGPRFNGVEDSGSAHTTLTASTPSMGPRFNGVEDYTADERCRTFGSTFNGATL